ncbi:MAG: caspase family protein [Candidatus Delongbacteria bacterium]|jgi:WD40 repeat protein|nr:caspase family protein [Candidatus Delongbacteria bacterium]
MNRNIMILSALITVFIGSAVCGTGKTENIIQLGHKGEIKCAALSQDGKFVVTGGEDKTIILWDVVSGKEIKRFTGSLYPISQIILTDDMSRMVSLNYDSAYRQETLVWDINSGKIIHKLSGNDKVRFLRDTKTIATGDKPDFSSKTLRSVVYDIITGETVKESSAKTNTNGFGEYITMMDDGVHAVSLSNTEHSVSIREVETGKEVKKFGISSDYSTIGSISGNGRICIVEKVSNNANIFYDIEKGSEIGTIPGYLRSLSYDGTLAITVKIIGDHTKKTDLIIWDTLNLNKIDSIKVLQGSCGPETRVITQGNEFLLYNENSTLYMYNLKEKKIVKTFNSSTSDNISLALSFDGKYAATGSFSNPVVKLWDIETGKLLKIFKNKTANVEAVSFSEDGYKIITGSSDFFKGINNLNIWNIADGKEILSLPVKDNSSEAVLLADNNTVYYSSLYEINLYNIKLKKNVLTLKVPYTSVPLLTPDKKYIVYSGDSRTDDNSVYFVSIPSGKIFKKLPGQKFDGSFTTGHTGTVVSADISSDGKKCVTAQKYCSSNGVYKQIILWDFENMKELRVFKLSDSYSDYDSNNIYVQFSPDGNSIIAHFLGRYGDICGVKVFDCDSGNELRTVGTGYDQFRLARVTPDGKNLVTVNNNNTLRVWDLGSGKNLLNMTASPDGTQWIAFDNEGIWDGSPDCGGLVAMVSGLDCWNIDQFAVKNNRPDIILERLGSDDKELISHYYQQYSKRLRKLVLSEEQISGELHVPVSIINDSKQEGKYFNLNFSLSDSKYQLKRYNVYVNDVPLYGSFGKEISGSSASLSEKIELISGTNKIEISCMNEKGTESYRALTYADYKAEGKGDLYYLAFGVSLYKDSSLNLKYADKDANDLSEAFSKLNISQFNNVYTKTFTNEQATVSNIRSAKDFLTNSKPDDTFILFIAGHGVHDTDKEATYYYLTHETDLNNLSATAANFELIEDILQGIPPRNKLFLMDTCESGEIEEGVQQIYYASAGSRGLKGRGIKVAEKASAAPVKTEKRAYLFEKDRYIYNDLARRSGAIVFSSSKGGELSYEKDDIQNGLFTEEIIKCLSSKEADKDNNGIISTDELRDYVSKAVAASSGDLQHPTVDRDNIYQKFGFGIK